MKTGFGVLCIAIALVCPTAHAEERAPGESPFHPPQTEAEKAVDEIVKMSIDKPDMFFIILQNPKYDLSQAKKFESFFTETFLIAWRQYEKNLVNENCNRKYQTGKNCGYDHNPLACSYPFLPPYFYRTVMGDGEEALITLALEDEKSHHNTYYVRHEKGRWKISGLTCDTDDPSTIPANRLMKKFRQPKIDSEKKLEEILHLARTSKDIIPFIFGLSWRNRETDHRFVRLFSPALLHAWKEQAARILEDYCGGDYREQGKGGCDFFNNPIYCRIEDFDLFVVRTTVERGKESIITYSYPGGHPRARFAYGMSKGFDGWRLNSVNCDDELRFNMLR